MTNEPVRNDAYPTHQGRLRDAAGLLWSVRAEVAWFAIEMEKRLRANDHKGGWTGAAFSICQAIDRIEDETEELREADLLLPDGSRRWNRITKEAADVANFAMMAADRARRKER